jgi:hypothetical protein
MEFLPGGTLADRVAAGPMTHDVAEAWFRQVLAGVEALHAVGVVHRDLKPNNVLIDASGRARVADLGIAKEAEPEEDGRRDTRGGMGTPAYIAPEQVWDASRVDARADLWALGALLFELLTGAPPFGDGRDVLIGGPLSTPAIPRGLPDHLVAVLERTLVPDPARRVATAAEVLRLLDERAPAAPATRTFQPPPSRASVAERPRPSRGRATATAMVVDPAGVGALIDVTVHLTDAPGGVETSSEVARDAQVAAQVAAAAALAGLTDRGVRWSVPAGAHVRGTSIGLAVAVAARAAALGRTVPPGHAFTGGVDLDGAIQPVHGVPAKVLAARASGVAHAWVPAGGPHDGATAVAHLDALWGRIGLRPRWLPWRLGLLLVPPALAFTGVLTFIDAPLHAAALRWASGALPIDDAVVVAVPPGPDLRALRARHPAVIDGLVDAGATAIVLDIALSAPSDDDAEIGAAMDRARARGVPVIVPVRLVQGAAITPASEAIRAAATVATVEFHADVALGWVVRAPARRTSLDGATWWHATAWAAAAHLRSAEPPRLVDGALRIGPLTNPASRSGAVALHPTEAVANLAYDAGSWPEAKGKVVFIGVVGGNEDVLRTVDGTRYGVEVLASMLQTLVRQAAPRRIEVEIEALAAFVVAVATAALARALRPASRWLAVVVPIAGLGVVIALAVGGTLMATSPIAIAGALGLYVVMRSGRR